MDKESIFINVLPEFLYPDKEDIQSYDIIYPDDEVIKKLSEKFKYIELDYEELIKNSNSYKNIYMMVFALSGISEKVTKEDAWESLFKIIDKKSRKNSYKNIVIKNYLPTIIIFDENIETVKKTASTIINNFKQEKNSDAICGISYLPCLDYTEKDLENNAFKALIHASMLKDEKKAVFDHISLNISSDRYFNIKDIDNAIKELEKALVLNNEDPNILNSLGIYYAIEKKFDHAMEFFRKSSEMDHKFIMPKYNLGLSLYLKKEYEKSEKIFLEAFDLSKIYYEIPFYIGVINYETEKYETALEYLNEAKNLNPDNVILLNIIGDIHIKLGRLDKAYNIYKYALKIKPENAYALSSLGFIYMKKGENIEIAESFMRKALEMEPDNILFRKRLESVFAEEDEVKEEKEIPPYLKKIK